MRKGIDVSKHNGTINWEQVKKAGIEFAILRAGYGRRTVDPTFHYNAKECQRLGISLGVYWFSYALSVEDAQNEAIKCLETVEGYELNEGIAFDFEADSLRYANEKKVAISYTLVSKMANAFLKEIKIAGQQPVLYSNRSMLRTHFKTVNMKDVLIWYANPSLEHPDVDCDIWQYSFTGKVNGISKDTDLNYSYVEQVMEEEDNPDRDNPTNDIPDWAKEAMEWAVEAGINDGIVQNETELQTVAMLYRYHKTFGIK